VKWVKSDIQMLLGFHATQSGQAARAVGSRGGFPGRIRCSSRSTRSTVASGAPQCGYSEMRSPPARRCGAEDSILARADSTSSALQGLQDPCPVLGRDARLIVRRIPKCNTSKLQDPLFPAWRLQAESTHRGHAIIEQVIADLKGFALAQLPSGKFAANAAWLAAPQTRSTPPAPSGSWPAAHSRKPSPLPSAPLARSARRLRLRLPPDWSWAALWQQLWTAVMTHPDHRAHDSRTPRRSRPDRPGKHAHRIEPLKPAMTTPRNATVTSYRWIEAQPHQGQRIRLVH
jgi:hypothetical protein